MNVSAQQQSEASGSTLALWEAKVLSISGDELDTILNDKASSSPPASSVVSTATAQPLSDAGHGTSTDIPTQAVTQDQNDAQQPSEQPTDSKEPSTQLDENVNIATPPYMKMIAKSIMASPMHRLVLSQIYTYIKQNYPTHVASKESWRNSVRHNLSTNQCFQRCGRAPNGRGFVWQIHPACMTMFRCGNFTRRDALSEVYRYERQNRASVERQQTGNAGVSMRQQNIPYYQPQNGVVTLDMLPGWMPQQYHHQMEDSQLYALSPNVQQNIFNGTMPQVSQPSNAQCQYMNNQGENISAQASFCQQNILNGPMPQVGQPSNAQCQYMNIQGQNVSAQGQYNIPLEQDTNVQGQITSIQGQYMNTGDHYTSFQGQYVNTTNQQTNTQGQSVFHQY